MKTHKTIAPIAPLPDSFPGEEPTKFLEQYLTGYITETAENLRKRNLPHVDAQDIVQKAVIRFCISVMKGHYDPRKGKPHAYFYCILRREFADYCDQARRNPTSPWNAIEESAAPERTTEPEPRPTSIAWQRMINQFGNLTDAEKGLITLFHDHCDTMLDSEMASRLSLTPGAFAMRKKRIAEKVVASVVTQAKAKGCLEQLSEMEQQAISNPNSSDKNAKKLYRSAILQLIECLLN